MFNSKFDGEVVTANDAQALADKLAADVAGWLQQGIDDRGSATLVVSGGSTPAPFFKALSLHQIQWSDVIVTLADERWVAADDELSNEKLIRECLLVNAASSARACFSRRFCSRRDSGLSAPGLSATARDITTLSVLTQPALCYRQSVLPDCRHAPHRQYVHNARPASVKPRVYVQRPALFLAVGL